MRVALVTSVFPQPRPGRSPGIERVAKSLADGLIDLGLELLIVTTYWNGGPHVDRYRTATVLRVADASKYLGRLASVGDAHYWSWGFAVARALKKVERPDVIHSLSPLSTTPSLVQAELPVVATFHHHEGLTSFRDILHKPFHRILEFRTYLSSTLVLTPSWASSRILQDVFGLPEHRIRVTPWGLNPDRFITNRSRAGTDSRLLFVGPHESRKGLEYLLEAIALLRSDGIPVRLTTVGTGPQMPSLQQLAKRLRISGAVQFEGYVSDPDDSKLPSVYAQADIFVLPSMQEGFGFVLVEAMASGLPVVATNVSAIPEVLGDAGVLVPPHDARALAAALRSLIENPNKRMELGEKGRSRAETFFSWGKALARIVSVYEEAIEIGGRV